jgi:hypothetical protein
MGGTMAATHGGALALTPLSLKLRRCDLGIALLTYVSSSLESLTKQYASL